MGEAEVTLFLGSFLCLVVMVTKPDVRALFPRHGRFRGELVDWPSCYVTTLLPKRPAVTLLCQVSESGLSSASVAGKTGSSCAGRGNVLEYW